MNINTLLKLAVFTATFLLLFSACEQDNPINNLIEEVEDPRGKVVSSELVGSYTPDQIDSLLAEQGSSTLSILSGDYSVNMYTIVYETIDAKGNPTTASGALAVPDTDNPRGFMSYQHGTSVRRVDVPSQGSSESLIGLIYSSYAGVVSAMPDYLGMGLSQESHPYMHGKSQATASLDMIRAGQRFCTNTLNKTLNDKLVILGYSQGGHATMALHKEIEENHSDEFTITAAAPMAGPYDVSGYQAEPFMSPEVYPAPYYLPYLLFSYNDVYELYGSPSDFLKAPFDVTLPPLFDGTYGGGQVNDAMMTNIPSEILLDDVLEDFKFNYNHPFRLALADNDLYDWKPEAPMHICHCIGDQSVLYENALVAYNSFRDKGKEDVTLVTPDASTGTSDHDDCVLPCLLDAIIWFDGFYE